MRNLILRLVVYAIAIVVIASIQPGVHILNDDLGTLVLLAIILGLVNAVIKPIVMVLSCPFILFSLGLLIPIINGAMLMLVASLSDGRLTIDHFGWAIGSGLIMMIIVIVLERVLGIDDAGRETDRRRRDREERVREITGRFR